MGKCIRCYKGLLLFAALFYTSYLQAQGDCNNIYNTKTFNSIQVFRNVVYSKNTPKLIAASLGTETFIGNSPNNFWTALIESTAAFFYEYMRPASQQILGPNFCAPNIIYSFNIANPQPGSDYCWENNSGNIVSANIVASTIDVIFNSGQIAANVKCSERDKADVLSLQSIKGVNIGNADGMVHSTNAENNFEILPNPTESSFNFELGDSEIYSVILIITDLLVKELVFIEIDKKATQISLYYSKGNYKLRYFSEKTIHNSILSIK
jgi:hypothetical protein